MPDLLQLDLAVLLALVAVMAFAGLVHGTLGLGFPVVSTPIVAAMFDVRMAIVLTVLPTVTVNLASIVGTKGFGTSLRRFWPLAAFGLVGSVAGTYLLTSVDPAPFRLLLAALIGVFLWTNRAGRVPSAWLHTHALTAMAVFGLGAGFAGGTTNVMVAVLIIYFLSIELPRPTMVPIMNTCFMVGKLSQLAVLAATGLLTWELLGGTAPLAAVALVAVLTGQRLRERVPVETYRRLLQWLLLALAVLLVYQFAAGV